MKKLLIASACVMSLSSAAFAQYQQPAPGASSEGNVGPGARTMAPREGMTTGSAATTRGTTRAGRMAPSSEGNVGPGTNNNTGGQPGGR